MTLSYLRSNIAAPLLLASIKLLANHSLVIPYTASRNHGHLQEAVNMGSFVQNRDLDRDQPQAVETRHIAPVRKLAENKQKSWCARRDLNPQPSDP